MYSLNQFRAAILSPRHFWRRVIFTISLSIFAVVPAAAASAPTFTLSVPATTVTLLTAGASVSNAITVTAHNGFTGSVAFSIAGVPSGVAASFSSASSGQKTTLTLKPGANAVPGTFKVSVTGTSGKLSSATTIALTVARSSFTLAASVSSLTLSAGYNSPINLVVTNPVNLVDRVSFSATGVPAGVTAGFASVNSTTESLTFTMSNTAAPGTYPITITGTSGTASSSTMVTVTILAQGFTLAASQSSLTLIGGGTSQSSAFTVTGQNGFNGIVNFAVSGVPTGVTASLSTASNQSKSTLTLQASSAAPAGTYSVKVTGTSGSLTGAAAITVTIPEPQFTISPAAGSLTLIEGNSATSTIDVTQPKGYGSIVALTASGVPAGVTAAFSPASTSASSSLTLCASSKAVPGTYAVKVTGTSGTVSSSTTIAVTIPTPSFTLASSAAALALMAGGSGASTTIQVNGANGFSGSVALTATGLPASVTAAHGSVSAGTSTTLTFVAGSQTVPGTYTATVTGVSGSTSAATSIQLTIPGPLSVSIAQPAYGFNVLPGSVRRIYATVTNGITNGVNWSVAGGGVLSSATGNWVDVTAPTTGSSCSIQGAVNPGYTVTSAKRITLTAQSQENPKMAASITINVCNPAVQVNVVPFYTTLYAGQKADIQAFAWGTVNRNVTWAITAEPNGGDGELSDSANQDTVFSANVAGRYTLTATSLADQTRSSSATIYVTGHSMPYDVTPSETIPVDCSFDPGLQGKTFDVGPSQTYKTINSVPWTSLTAGSTVRIHNEDTTGDKPTTYHEYFLVSGQGTSTQPIRVCGVPDQRGNLPVIDGGNATTSSTYPGNLVGFAVVTIGKGGWAGVYTGSWTGPQYLIVEGLKVQNARQPATHASPTGAAGTPWAHGAACVRLFQTVGAVVRGIDANGCSNGIFSDFNANNGYAVVENTLYEGNHVHDNGESGYDSYHQLYIQGWNEVVQFNVIDQYQSGAGGSDLKGRGFPEIIRYNHFGDGAARELDLVDNQDAQPYTSFEGYLEGTSASYRSTYPKDAYTADLLAAAVEAHHADFVYGNTFVNTTAGVPIHYATDHGSLEDDRIGTLWFYNNSFYEPEAPAYSWNLFDTSGGGGENFQEIEWPQIQVINNAIWMDAPTEPYFNWNRVATQFTTFGANAINSNWGTGTTTGGNGTGWDAQLSNYAFQGAGIDENTTGVSNLRGVTAEPFNVTTFLPNAALINAGTQLPRSISTLPVRFQFGPSAVQAARTQPLTLGAME